MNLFNVNELANQDNDLNKDIEGATLIQEGNEHFPMPDVPEDEGETSVTSYEFFITDPFIYLFY